MGQIRNKRTKIQWLVSEFAEGGGGDNMEFFDRLRDAKAYAATTKHGYTISKCETTHWDELYRYDEGATEWQEQFDYEILKVVG